MRKGNAIALISRIREKANRLIVSELEANGIVGIVPSHGDIVQILFEGEKFTMKDIAEKIHRTKPTVTVLIDKLVDCGYVVKEKNSTDKRETYIRLTENGLKLRPFFEAISKKLNDIVYSGLDNSEAEKFEMILLKINNRLS
jgi:Transcriptional regulators